MTIVNDHEKMIEKNELEIFKLTPERQKQLQEEMHGPNGYPTFEHERACGYNPFNESL